MDQLHLLWEYQKADVEVDNVEKALKLSPVRKNLVKQRDLYNAQVSALEKINNDVNMMEDRLETLKDAIRMTSEQLHSLHAKIESDPPKSLDDVMQYLNSARRLQNNLNAYEKDVKDIQKDVVDREKEHRDANNRKNKARVEFTKLKEVYEQEKKEKEEQLARLRAAAQKKAVVVEPEFMGYYKEVKRHSTPPLAALYGDQCGGCNMSVPSSVSRRVRAGELMECENCGRLLIIL